MKKIFNYGNQLHRGRIGRKHYVLGLLVVIIATVLSVFLTIALVEIKAPYAVLVIIPGVAIFACVAFKLSLDIRRLQDTGHSGLWILLLLIPYVNLALLIYLLLWKGDNQANQYGTVKRKGFMEDLFLSSFWKV